MTISEVKKVIKILVDVDSGCSVCAREALLLFIEEFPETKQLCCKIYKDEHEDNLID